MLATLKFKRKVSLRLWLIALVAMAAGASACSTLVHGMTQTIDLEMKPAGATATIYRWDGAVVAGPVAAPGEIRVPRPLRNEPYLIVVAKDGYCPAYFAPRGDVTVTAALTQSVAVAAPLGLLGPPTVAVFSTESTIGGGTYEIYDDSFRRVELKEAQQCD